MMGGKCGNGLGKVSVIIPEAANEYHGIVFLSHGLDLCVLLQKTVALAFEVLSTYSRANLAVILLQD